MSEKEQENGILTQALAYHIQTLCNITQLSMDKWDFNSKTGNIIPPHIEWDQFYHWQSILIDTMYELHKLFVIDCVDDNELCCFK